jgi:hypothetical protein
MWKDGNMGRMATTKRPQDAGEPARTTAPAGADQSGNDWDFRAGPSVPDRPAGETMPRRAAKLPNQNGNAMRSVFAYLLDEDAPPPPESPAPRPRTKKG